MADAQQPLRLNEFVGYYTHERRHKNGYDALDGIKPWDQVSHSSLSKIITHASEISSPDSEFQEIHYCQTKFQVHIINNEELTNRLIENVVYK
jgi:hypothetical protein